MGSIYRRKDSRFWWLAFENNSGLRELASSGTQDRAEAERRLARVEAEVATQKAAGLVLPQRLTVRRYAQIWLKARRQRGVLSVDGDANWLGHAMKSIGDMELTAVTRDDLVALIGRHWRAGELAPRSVLRIYATLRTLFRDACIEKLIQGSPCTLRTDRNELPPNDNADPLFEETAIFDRSELELLISCPAVAWRNRMLYGLAFLSGMRIGEVLARRWRDYDATLQPLGRLLVGTSWSSKRKAEGQTKTKKARRVPVHPVLAQMLAEWKLSGWQQYVGRAPGLDDLIVPAMDRRNPRNPRGPHFLHATSVWVQLQDDLGHLGLRPRRVHDTRATFISLALADEARGEILRFVTHPPRKDSVSIYTRLPWLTLCQEVGKLKVRLREGQVLTLHCPSATPRYGTE